MAAVRSIFEYVSNKCYNGLFDAAKEYLDEHWREMNLETIRVPTIDSYELADAKVQRVYVSDLPGDRIAFDVGLELEVAVSMVSRHNDSEDTSYPWLRFSCEGDLSQGLEDWTIKSTEPYAKRNPPPNSMSDALVPDISPTQYEKVATDFLEEYYPEALRITKYGESPVYVDPNILAERLDLSVATHRINKEGSIFGQLFFLEADTEMYDAEHDQSITVHVPAKTIVVDPQMYLLRNLGSANNTIVHECVHWVKHRKVFMLEKLYNDQAHGITCEVVGGARANMSKLATARMEQQANRLTPRIQMPAGPFKAKASDYIAKFMREMGAHHEIEVMETVIEQLHVDFVVSRQAAKIRMVELGFEAAVGTFTFVDGHYVPPHSYSKGAISRNQTFTISGQDAAIQRLVNPALRSLTQEGDYLFLENHYVFKAPLYVEKRQDGHLQLTPYARSHMDECCLVFDMEVKGEVGTEYYTVCYLNREEGAYTFNISYNEDFQAKTKDQQKAFRQQEKQEEMGIRMQMTENPSQCMKLLMDWRKMSNMDLGVAINRDARTIRRIVNGENTPNLETAVLICLGLNLPPTISYRLLEVFGVKLMPGNTTHLWYQEALNVKYNEPVEDAQAYLAEFDVELK